MAMPRCDGLELLRRIRSRSDVPVIIFSGHGSVENASDAFKAGADDFIDSLKLDIDELVRTVRKAARSKHIAPNPQDLEQRLVGRSPAIERVRWQITGLAPLTTPVLVSGDTGTGRSTTIRALHELGSTSTGELHRIDALRFRNEAESQGTVAPSAFHIQGVEQLSPETQTLWAERLAKPEARSPKSAQRVFASTSTPLASLVRSGDFHPVLGNALLRFHVELPPLRERTEDIPEIAKALLQRIGTSVGRSRIQLSPAALKHLETCPFPENIRQLERLLERAAAYSVGRVIRRQTLQDLIVDLEDSVETMRQEKQLLEREKLLRTLQDTGGNITHTAEALKKSRAAIYRLMTKHNIPLTRGG
jgi:DNA-binding NtrC family response regulator